MFDLPKIYTMCVSDWRSRGDVQEEIDETDVYFVSDRTKVFTHSRKWGDASCGHGGMAPQTITDSHTVVFYLNGHAWVYQGGKFSYKVRPSDKFWEDLRNHQLDGEIDFEPSKYDRNE